MGCAGTADEVAALTAWSCSDECSFSAGASTPPRRVVVVGSTGSGKTTLARQIAACFNGSHMSHIELDALYWEPGWTAAAPDRFHERVERALAEGSWVVDGNYSSVREIVWGRADTIVWLDYSPWVIAARLVPRTLRRGIRGEELWNGNRERLREQLFSRDSLFLWAIKTYRRRRREFATLLRQPRFTHLAVVHLRSPQSTVAWLEHECRAASMGLTAPPSDQC
jgi:adenylate kinase family enzyme